MYWRFSISMPTWIGEILAASAPKSEKSCGTKNRIFRAEPLRFARTGGHHAIVVFPARPHFIFAVALVYLLMTVNFQSWLDPFIIFTALPGALAGILRMLFVTGTTLSVPSLMGAIMCIGVATANSILMVTFANDERGRRQFQRATAMLVGRLRAHASRSDDGHRHDPGHASHGARHGRRR